MAELVVDDVCEVTFDRALRGYRTQYVDAFLSQLAVARRTGSPVSELEEMVRLRDFPIAFGGYDCRGVDTLIESAARSWRTYSEAAELRDQAFALKAQLLQTVGSLLDMLDQAGRQLRAIDTARTGGDAEATATSTPTDSSHYHVQLPPRHFS